MSVLVAARDAAATLSEALASVHAQSYADWEAIVVDDGSIDETGAIAEAHGARVVRHAGPLGPAAARNRAAAEASGELLATLDADDAWLPDFLAVQVAAYDGTPDAGLVTCDAHLRDERGALLEETWDDRVGAPDRVTLTTLLETNTAFTGVVIPRELFQRLGGYAEDMVHAEDFDLWLRVAGTARPILHTSRPLAIYRISPAGLSAEPGRLSTGAREAYDRALRRGGLTRAQRRLARRQRRLHALVARRAQAGRGGRIALLPCSALVALEHPGRWAHWLGVPKTPRTP